MAEGVPEGCLISHNCGYSYTSDSLKLPSSDNITSNLLASQVSESNSNLGNPLASNGNHTLPEAAEWVEQAEPGVYFTISFLPGGNKCLKRVRFRYCQSPLIHLSLFTSIFFLIGVIS